MTLLIIFFILVFGLIITIAIRDDINSLSNRGDTFIILPFFEWYYKSIKHLWLVLFCKKLNIPIQKLLSYDLQPSYIVSRIMTCNSFKRGKCVEIVADNWVITKNPTNIRLAFKPNKMKWYKLPDQYFVLTNDTDQFEEDLLKIVMFL